jgi:hypothetical protein
MYEKSLAVTLSLLVLLSVAWAQKNKRLSESEAIKKAEQFVIEQGYTDLPPTGEKSRLRPEAVHGGIDASSLALRRNTLERLAYGTLKEEGKNGQWIVIFRYAAEPHSNRARAVSVQPSGKDIRIEHQDFNLEFAKLRKIER